MATNVIRKDVVQIGFEVDNNPYKGLVGDLDKMKKAVTGVGK